MSSQLQHSSVEPLHYQFEHKIYEKGSGRLFQIFGQKLVELEPLSRTHQSYLNCLIDKQGSTATFDELTQLEGKHVNNNTVSKHIGKIKKQVGCDIENIPRQGYKLHSRPVLVDLANFQIQTPDSTQSIEESPNKPTKIKRLPALLVFLLALVLMLFSDFFKFNNSEIRNLTHQKATMMQGKESRGVLSPDGRFLVFEYRKSSEQLSSLWIKNLQTGEKKPLTESKAGVDDEVSAFSADGQRLLFHRTEQDNVCNINEITFSSFEPIEFSHDQLFQCNAGHKSLNAEYGKDINTIFFTDYVELQKGHHVFRFDRLNNESREIYSLSTTGQGIYRVYPLAGGEQLLMLSSDDWSNTQISLLNLSDNKMSPLLEVPQPLGSIAVDKQNRTFYFVELGDENQQSALVKFDLLDGKIVRFGLQFEHSSFVSISAQTRQLAINGKSFTSKKIVKLENPLKHSNYQVLDEIASSGSDNLPQVCGDALYFFSSRGSGKYSLWKKLLKQDLQVLVYPFDYQTLPENYALSPSCNKIAVVGNGLGIRLVDFGLNQSIERGEEIKFINAGWLDEAQLLATISQDEIRLNRIKLTDFSIELISALPQSKVFLLAFEKQQMWLLGHQDNQLLRYDFASKTKTLTRHTIPLFRNSSWINWQDQGIYYIDDNEINPVLSYQPLGRDEAAHIPLPKSFKNAHITMAQGSDDALWIVQIKSPQRDIYLLDLP
jgi:DNA-binding winged helix-turn-helix (wHTH) protein